MRVILLVTSILLMSQVCMDFWAVEPEKLRIESVGPFSAILMQPLPKITKMASVPLQLKYRLIYS